MIRRLAVALLSYSFLVCGATAAEPSAAKSPEAARKVLADWYAKLAAAKSLSVEFHDEVVFKRGADVLQSDEAIYRLTFQRPQSFALTSDGGMVSVINNDRQFYEYLAAKGKYELRDAPLTSFAELSKSKLLKHANFSWGLGLLGEALVAADAEAFLAAVKSPEFVGTEDLNDAKALHLRYLKDETPVDVWFSTDASQMLKFAPDLLASPDAKKYNLPPDVSLSLTIELNDWSYDAAPAAEAFAVAPPAEAEQVDDIFAQPIHRLLGRQAPAFETTDLNGHPVKLADLAGKVVVLDFWATWCPLCVEALPQLSATAAKFKDRGVVFYAVNIQEEPSIIREFLAHKNLQVPVALDPEAKVTNAYFVEPLPQTVIIDQHGKIQVVHVGPVENVGEVLAQELSAVLEGQDLADKKLPQKPQP